MIASNCTPQRWQPAWERPDANTATLPEWSQLTNAYKRYIYGDTIVNTMPEAAAREWNARSRNDKKVYFLKPRTLFVGNRANPYFVTAFPNLRPWEENEDEDFGYEARIYDALWDENGTWTLQHALNLFQEANAYYQAVRRHASDADRQNHDYSLWEMHFRWSLQRLRSKIFGARISWVGTALPEWQQEPPQEPQRRAMSGRARCMSCTNRSRTTRQLQ